MAEKDYGSEQIQVLEGLEAVRKRPGMYIGSTEQRGLHHLVFEVVDNSIDEALAGHCDCIDVTIHEDHSVTVRDNGRGIPVDEHPEYGLSGVEVVMTRLHAGGKFDSTSYEISGGLHGVGVSVVNALSKWLEVTVLKDGIEYFQRYENGKPTGSVQERGGTTETGTRIQFLPDDGIFETQAFDFDVLSKKFRELAYLNEGLQITLDHELEDREESYEFEEGIQAFVKYLNRNYDTVHDKVVFFEETVDEIQVKGALQWSEDSYTNRLFAFANNINTHEGGTHVTGMKRALTRVVKQYGLEKGILDEEDELKGEDVREGLTAVLSVLIPEPQFEGQTKTKLGNSEARGVVERVITKQLGRYLREHPSIGEVVVKRAEAAARARKAAEKAKQLTRRKTALNSGSLPGKLADCQTRDSEKSEIFIVEGDSAGGSAKQARNRKYQAILPLRGKILNVEKSRLDRILENEEIKTMITALGAGVGEEDLALSELRYGKIIIMTDADVDGAHIRTLLLTLFFRHMRKLIVEGHVYIAQPPLYRVYANGKEEWVYKEQQLQDVLDTFGGNESVQRYKGLGEMNPQQLLETTLDPETRTLYQVTLQDAVRADELFSTLMGDEVEPRRQFIQEHADEVQNLDV